MRDRCPGSEQVVPPEEREQAPEGWLGGCQVCGAWVRLTTNWRPRPHVNWLKRRTVGAPTSVQDDEPGSIPGLRSTSTLWPLAPIVELPARSLVLWPTRPRLVQPRLF